jgi:Protein of unknown function (DUF2635)
MFVKPGPGLVLRDPVTKQFIPAEGVEVPDGDLFWQRRLRDGDVVPATPPAEKGPAE